MSCFGHNLHLVVTNSMKDDVHISRAFGVCRNWLDHLPIVAKKRELSEAQIQFKI